MFTIQDYIDSLNRDKESLVANLTTKGITCSDSETFTTLVPKVLDITSVNNQSKSETITSNTTTTITPDEGYTGLSSVSVTTNVALDLSNYFITEADSSIMIGKSLVKKFDSPITFTFSGQTYNGFFADFGSLVEAPMITNQLKNISTMYDGCYSLVSVPIYDTSAVTDARNTFRYCTSLSDTALDNILQMCANTTSNYGGTKTLAYMGITNQTYFPASRIQALPHYQDFIDAGWTIS